MTNSLFDKNKGWKEGPRYWSYRPMSLELAFRQLVIGCNQSLRYFGTVRLKRDGVCWSTVLHIYGYDTPQVLAALVATYGSDITPLTGAQAASHYLQRWLRGRWHYNNSWTLHTPGIEAKNKRLLPAAAAAQMSNLSISEKVCCQFTQLNLVKHYSLCVILRVLVSETDRSFAPMCYCPQDKTK